MEWVSETFDLFHSTGYEIEGRLKFSFKEIGHRAGVATKITIKNFSRVESLDVRVSWHRRLEKDSIRIHKVKPRGTKKVVVPTLRGVRISWRYS